MWTMVPTNNSITSSKPDLDLERLPSGKFATKDVILSLAMLVYNVLRLIGQGALLSDDAPIRQQFPGHLYH